MITKQAPQALINSILVWCPLFEQIQGAIIAGGFLRSFYRGETPKDMDIYFESSEAFETAKDSFNNGENGWKLMAETEFALSYNDNRGRAVQLIRFVYGQVDEIIKEFDFTICSAACKLMRSSDQLTGIVCMHDDFFEHLAGGVLLFTGSAMPLSSLKRAFKFVKRGYHICDENIIALGEAVTRSINFDSQESVEQQIAGMDPDGGRRIRAID
jgi:hypothetical protein